jgi:hypothetical protein
MHLYLRNCIFDLAIEDPLCGLLMEGPPHQCITHYLLSGVLFHLLMLYSGSLKLP